MNPEHWAWVGDSFSTMLNGASLVTVPHQVELLANSLGADIKIDNFSLPGLTWKTALVPIPGWTIGGLSPVQALLSRPRYDRIIYMMGVNDRQNPNALADYQAFRAAFPASIDGGAPLGYVQQNYLLDDGTVPPGLGVTQGEAEAMAALYATILDPFYGVNIGKLFKMGFCDGEALDHPTNSGKQWIATSIYMGLSGVYGWPPTTRNIAWLYSVFLTDPVLFAAMVKINT